MWLVIVIALLFMLGYLHVDLTPSQTLGAVCLASGVCLMNAREGVK